VLGWVLRTVGGLALGGGIAASQAGASAERDCIFRESVKRLSDLSYDAECTPWSSIGQWSLIAGAALMVAGIVVTVRRAGPLRTEPT
jgi:hypothetical protein